MDVWWRVRRSAGGVRARSTVVAGAQQLFGTPLVLVRRLSGQALSRVFPLSRSGEVTVGEKKKRKKLTKTIKTKETRCTVFVPKSTQYATIL